MKSSRRSIFFGFFFSGIFAASLGFASSAAAEGYLCTPGQIAAFPSRVHVRCTAAATGGIWYFAVCAEQNAAFASRAFSAFTTAKALGKNLFVYYTPADTSGTSCGCLASDCRAMTGVEVVN